MLRLTMSVEVDKPAGICGSCLDKCATVSLQ